MAKIPLPERGQPLDVEYLYQIATAINSLANQVTSATNKYTTINTPSSGPKVVKTGDARIVGGYVSVDTSKASGGANSASFTFPLGEGFKYSPVVTATPISRGATSIKTDVSVVINSVTTQSVTGQIYFVGAGNFSMAVNIIAIGIPV
jgi:hypothetical protein